MFYYYDPKIVTVQDREDGALWLQSIQDGLANRMDNDNKATLLCGFYAGLQRARGQMNLEISHEENGKLR